jgi:hypothetical protein
VKEHALVHNIQPANCTFPWDDMEGSDTVRSCPICKTKVYCVNDLDERQILDLVAETSPMDLAELKLHRRSDGTVMLNPGSCAVVARRKLLTWVVIDACILLCAVLLPLPTMGKIFLTAICFVIVVEFGIRMLPAQGIAAIVQRYKANRGVYYILLCLGIHIMNKLAVPLVVDLFVGRILIIALIPIHLWLVAGNAVKLSRIEAGYPQIGKSGNR